MEKDDFVVINKPAGVQVTPTVDNSLESCLTLGAKVLFAGMHFGPVALGSIREQKLMLLGHKIRTCCTRRRPLAESSRCSSRTGSTHAQRASSSWAKQRSLCSGSMHRC